MGNDGFNKENVGQYWREASDDDYETMRVMFDSKRYSWSLFIGHLMIEKLLKAYFVKVKNDYPPYIHNLLRLAEMAGLNLNEEQAGQFAVITSFNINARYDDYKQSFRRLCTPEFTLEWINNISNLRIWMLQQLKQ
jgi:HEPN domain-containing protein